LNKLCTLGLLLSLLAACAPTTGAAPEDDLGSPQGDTDLQAPADLQSDTPLDLALDLPADLDAGVDQQGQDARDTTDARDSADAAADTNPDLDLTTDLADTSADTDQGCQPACDGRQCGPDGCGGTCGTCVPPHACQTTRCVEGHCELSLGLSWCLIAGECFPADQPAPLHPCLACAPAATQSTWTPLADGAGCGEGFHCMAGECVCKPQCDGRTCGPDGCEGVCGTCEDGFQCNPLGLCQKLPRTCGDTPCPVLEGFTQSCNSAGLCVNANKAGLGWVSLPGGTFMMGCSPGDDACAENEKPVHQVTVSPFQLLEAEITEAQYEAVAGVNPSVAQLGEDYPVDNLNWAQADVLCRTLGGRLPTEAEWEYAARAGTTSRYGCGSDGACLEDVAWFGIDSREGKRPVKQKAPNGFGLYDTLGNMAEWVSDWFAYDYYSVSPAKDPLGPATGSQVITRGGGFFLNTPEASVAMESLRVSRRATGFLTPENAPYLGVRCARSLPCTRPKDEGAVCNSDGDACNGTSTCRQGACVLTTPPVQCKETDPCKAGTCDPQTGQCSLSALYAGAVCKDDSNACNGVSTCVAGVCRLTTPAVACEPIDECHVKGICNPKTGLCANPAGNNLMVCEDDGDSCNGVSTCSGGLCLLAMAPAACGGGCGVCPYGGTCNAHGQCSFAGPKEIVWVALAGGPFTMGCSPGDTSCADNERPAHGVTLAPFKILETEVTEAQYEALMGANPSANPLGGPFPVENVNWLQAKAFCEALGGSLPTEAQLEFAARGGTPSPFYCGADPGCLKVVAWTLANADGQKHPVGQKLPNAYGLYDLTGNVWEWAQDWYHGSYEGAPDDGAAWLDPSSTYRVIRGGSFLDEAHYQRASARVSGYQSAYYYYNVGFRCVRQD
jgi:formylglycine-generating enzyme required for sulfatase activity